MSRSRSVWLAVSCLLLCASCGLKRHATSTVKPTFRFGVPRGTTVDAPGRPPIELTASDGTGLALVSLDAKVAIEGPLAFTELTMGFQNPGDRTLEGHFDVVLPDGAAVSRFAMQLPSGWQEAEVVEKQAARVAYEDFLHRRQDPALLEKAAGNEFSARVFPIGPRAIKLIKLSYSQELPTEDAPYRLPLRGLPLMPALRVVVFVEEQVVRVVKDHYLPEGDFLLERAGAASGLQSGKLVALRLRPPLPAAAAAMSGLTILLDTSASRAPGFAKQVTQLVALVEAIRSVHGDALSLRVAAFDQSVAPLYVGTAGGFAGESKSIIDKVIARGALGASDIAGALAWAAKNGEDQHQRLLLITDGVATASASVVPEKIEEAGDDAIAMARAADGLKSRFDRLDVLLVGGIRDGAAMRPLVTHHLSQDGAVLEDAGSSASSEDMERLARRLDEATRSGVHVSVDGASWVWPAVVDGIQRGDDLMVYAVMEGERSRSEVTVSLSGPVAVRAEVPIASPDVPGLGPLVERAWARASIASLESETAALPPGDRSRVGEIQKKELELSTRYRVLCDLTSLLVLDRESDYARFHIDRHALADILVVDDDGLRLTQRHATVGVEPDVSMINKGEMAEQYKVKAKKSVASNIGAAMVAGVFAVPTEREAKALPGDPMGDLTDGNADGEDAARAQRATVEEPPRAIVQPMPPPAAPRPVYMTHASHMAAPRHAALESTLALPSADMAVNDLPLSAADRIRNGQPNPNGPAPPSYPDVPSWTGHMLEVMTLIQNSHAEAAVASAKAWRSEEPGDVLALVALGNAWRAQGKLDDAARAYGSIIDLFPARADLRRFAGDQLESLGAAGEALAADTFAHAVRDRPDHPNSHRLHAYSLLRAGHLAEAFAAIEAGAARRYPEDRFRGVDQIMREDSGLIGAAWLAHDPARRAEIEKRLSALSATLPTTASLRFVLSWETDANDVDFHISDRMQNHAWFAQKHLASGGDLYADVTTGYGPECFTIEGKPAAFPYQIRAHYYSRGPMGYGMGKVEILQHDGHGGLLFEERPFVVMNDQAYVDMGSVTGPLGASVAR